MTLLKDAIIIEGRKLSARGENDTAANDDIAVASSMSIRHQDGEVAVLNERQTRARGENRWD